MTTLSAVILKGVYAALPVAGVAGRLYFATDTQQIFRDNGTTWDNVTPSTAGATQLSVSSVAPGNFQVAHGLGEVPASAVILMTSPGAIWFQAATLWDATNIYLCASDAGITAVILVYA